MIGQANMRRWTTLALALVLVGLAMGASLARGASPVDPGAAGAGRGEATMHGALLGRQLGDVYSRSREHAAMTDSERAASRHRWQRAVARSDSPKRALPRAAMVAVPSIAPARVLPPQPRAIANALGTRTGARVDSHSSSLRPSGSIESLSLSASMSDGWAAETLRATRPAPVRLKFVSAPPSFTFLKRVSQLYSITRPELEVSVVASEDSYSAVRFVEEGQADLALSSLIPSAADAARAPDLLHLPLWTYAYAPITHVPELSGRAVVFDMPTLCRIFRGDITTWNHSALVATNPLLAAVSAPIEVVLPDNDLSYVYDFTALCPYIDPDFGAVVAESSRPVWPRHLYARSRFEADVVGPVSYVLSTPHTVSLVLNSYAKKLGASIASMYNRDGAIARPSFASVDGAVRASLLLAERDDVTGQMRYSFSNRLSQAVGEATWPLNAAAMLAIPRTYVRTNCRAQSEMVKFLRWMLTDAAVRYDLGSQESAVLLPVEVDQLLQLSPTLQAIQCGPVGVNVDDAFAILSGGGSVATTHTRMRQVLMARYEEHDPSHVAITNILQSPETALADMIDPRKSLDITFFFPQAYKYIWQGNLEAHIDHSRIRFMPWAAHGVVPSYSFTTQTLALLQAAEALPLRLDMETLGGIFTGAIRSWTDPALLHFNPTLGRVFSGAAAGSAESQITLVLYGVGDRDHVGESALSNALVLSLNRTRAVRDSGLPWIQPADWRPVTGRLDALGVRYLMVSNEIELEAAVARIPGAVGYKLAFSNESDPHTDFAIVRFVEPSLEATPNATPEELQPYNVTVLGVPAAFAACGEGSKPTSGGHFDMQEVAWNAAPSAAQCWPITLLVTIALPADAHTVDASETSAAAGGAGGGGSSLSAGSIRAAQTLQRVCDHQKRVARYAEFLLFDENLPDASARSGYASLSSVPWLREVIREELNGVWCGGVPLLYTPPVRWSMTMGVKGFAVIGAAVSLLACLAATIIVLKFRSRAIIQTANLPLQLAILAGVAMLLACPLLFTLSPDGAACRSLGWLLAIGFTLTYGPIAAKIWRVHATFKQRRSLKAKRISTRRLYAMVAALVAIDIILLGVADREDGMLTLTVTSQMENSRVHQYEQCTVSDGALPIAATLFGLKAALLLLTSVLAFGVRHVSSAFNESANLSWAIWNSTLSCGILMPILVLVGGGAGDIHSFLLVFLALWIAASTLVFSFGKKLGALLLERWRLATEASRMSRTSRTSCMSGTQSGTGTGTSGLPSWAISGAESAMQMPSLGGVPLAVLERYLIALEEQLLLAKERRRAAYGTDDDAPKSHMQTWNEEHVLKTPGGGTEASDDALTLAWPTHATSHDAIRPPTSSGIGQGQAFHHSRVSSLARAKSPSGVRFGATLTSPHAHGPSAAAGAAPELHHAASLTSMSARGQQAQGQQHRLHVHMSTTQQRSESPDPGMYSAAGHHHPPLHPPPHPAGGSGRTSPQPMRAPLRIPVHEGSGPGHARAPSESLLTPPPQQQHPPPNRFSKGRSSSGASSETLPVGFRTHRRASSAQMRESAAAGAAAAAAVAASAASFVASPQRRSLSPQPQTPQSLTLSHASAQPQPRSLSPNSMSLRAPPTAAAAASASAPTSPS